MPAAATPRASGVGQHPAPEQPGDRAEIVGAGPHRLRRGDGQVAKHLLDLDLVGAQLPRLRKGAAGLVVRATLQESMGEDFASQLHCKSACLTACEKAFEHFGFDVNVGMDATMPVDEYCQFSIRPA